MEEVINAITELLEVGSKEGDIIIAYPRILELPLQELI